MRGDGTFKGGILHVSTQMLGALDHGRRAVDAVNRPTSLGEYLCKLEIQDAV